MSNTNSKVIGYGSPPNHSRFKKGASGNPSGQRKPKPTELFHELVREEAARVINLKADGREMRLRSDAALARSLVNQAAKGHNSAVRLLFQLLAIKEEDNQAVEAAIEKDRKWRELLKQRASMLFDEPGPS